MPQKSHQKAVSDSKYIGGHIAPDLISPSRVARKTRQGLGQGQKSRTFSRLWKQESLRVLLKCLAPPPGLPFGKGSGEETKTGELLTC